MEWNQDFNDMLSALNDAGVDYLVVGAHAVAAYGYPRATGDLDIWVRADAPTAPKIIKALAQFGAPVDQVDSSDFAIPEIVFQIGLPPRRIDILTVVSGLNFSTAWKHKLEITIDDLTIPVIGKKDLITNKRASGRPKDLADLAELESMDD